MKQKLIELKQILRKFVIIAEFSATENYRTKINKDVVELNTIIKHQDLTYISLHPKTTEYVCFSNTSGVFTKTVHILVHKTHLNKFERINKEYILYSRIKLDISNNRKIYKDSEI